MFVIALLKYESHRNYNIPGLFLTKGEILPVTVEVDRMMWEFQEALQNTIIAWQAACGKDAMSASGQVVVGMATTRIKSNVMLLIPWRDARYCMLPTLDCQDRALRKQASLRY